MRLQSQMSTLAPGEENLGRHSYGMTRLFQEMVRSHLGTMLFSRLLHGASLY